MPTDISKIRPCTQDQLKQLFTLKTHLVPTSSHVSNDDSDCQKAKVHPNQDFASDEEDEHEENDEDEDEEEEESGVGDDDNDESDESDENLSGSDSSGSWGSDLDDLEAEMTRVIQHRSNSSPALMNMQTAPSASSQLNLTEQLYRSESEGYLQRSTSARHVSRAGNARGGRAAPPLKPSLQLELLWEGLSPAHFPSHIWQDYFMEIRSQHVRAHTHQVERAIRDQDLDALQAMLQAGQSLQTCNRYGESTLHIAGRRGSLPLMRFLLEQARVNVRIRDDVGRSCLSDACWSHQPKFDLIKVILEEAPELILVADKRGFTPLCYCPKETWGLWTRFLQDNKEWLIRLVQNMAYPPARKVIEKYYRQWDTDQGMQATG